MYKIGVIVCFNLSEYYCILMLFLVFTIYLYPKLLILTYILQGTFLQTFKQLYNRQYEFLAKVSFVSDVLDLSNVNPNLSLL